MLVGVYNNWCVCLRSWNVNVGLLSVLLIFDINCCCGRVSGQACVCKEPEECPEADGFLCVAVGDDSAITMSECEVSMLRCHGEPFMVTSIGACASWCYCCWLFKYTVSVIQMCEL